MLNQNVALVDIDPEHFTNLIKLVTGGFRDKKKPKPDGGKKKKKSMILLLMKDGKCVKAVHSKRGVLRGYVPRDLDDLEGLADYEDVARVTVMEQGVPRKIMSNIQSGLTLDMNFGEQALHIYGCIREEMGRGIMMYPRPKMPDVKYVAVTTTLKIAAPPGELILIVVHSDNGTIRDSSNLPIVTSGIIRFNEKMELDLITSTDSLVPNGLTIGDYKKDYKKLNKIAEKVWDSKVYLALHIPFSSLKGLAPKKGVDPGKNLLAMRKKGELIIDPFPLRLRGLLKMGGVFKR